MPTGTRVHNCVTKLRKKYGYGHAIGICQKSTKQNYMTGKTIRKKRKKRRKTINRGGRRKKIRSTRRKRKKRYRRRKYGKGRNNPKVDTESTTTTTVTEPEKEVTNENKTATGVIVSTGATGSGGGGGEKQQQPASNIDLETEYKECAQKWTNIGGDRGQVGGYSEDEFKQDLTTLDSTYADIHNKNPTFLHIVYGGACYPHSDRDEEKIRREQCLRKRYFDYYWSVMDLFENTTLYILVIDTGKPDETEARSGWTGGNTQKKLDPRITLKFINIALPKNPYCIIFKKIIAMMDLIVKKDDGLVSFIDDLKAARWGMFSGENSLGLFRAIIDFCAEHPKKALFFEWLAASGQTSHTRDKKTGVTRSPYLLLSTEQRLKKYDHGLYGRAGLGIQQYLPTLLSDTQGRVPKKLAEYIRIVPETVIFGDPQWKTMLQQTIKSPFMWPNMETTAAALTGIDGEPVGDEEDGKWKFWWHVA